MDLADLVCGIFAFQGFSVVEVTRGRPGEPAGVVVRRGPLEIAIAVVPGSSPLGEDQVDELVGELANRPGARHLIAHAGAVTDGARAAAAVHGAVLWDRERLVSEAGASLVAVADPDPFHPSGGGERIEKAGREGFDSPVRAKAGRGWTDWGANPPPGRGGKRRRRTLAPARGEDGEALLGVMPPRADEERARQIAGAGRGRVLRLALEWVPAYLVDYHVVADLETPRQTQTVLASGTLVVSAASGESELVEGPIEVVPARQLLDKETLGRALARRRLSLIEARERARREALERTDRTVWSNEGGGGTTVTEARRQRPRGTEVDLLARGLLILPYYLAETEKGLVTVNAGTGRVVREAPFAGGPGEAGGAAP